MVCKLRNSITKAPLLKEDSPVGNGTGLTVKALSLTIKRVPPTKKTIVGTHPIPTPPNRHRHTIRTTNSPPSCNSTELLHFLGALHVTLDHFDVKEISA
ncbi:unnamed protein product [Dovyalis caffra]|uniref:Uncharacterized protein n=1 Tax=Dovyalis caffra TaxID=77055 RepID=A0AAV1SW61_9ROSI|nr:unnamed protein product [Dovyalis caffra]